MVVAPHAEELGAPGRPRGRPRSERADAAIVAATLGVLGRLGFAGLTVEAVAASAGVGKATIYRRWDTKDDLVVHALSCLKQGTEPVLVGDLRRDLIACLESTRRSMSRSLAGRVMPHVLATAPPELQRLYWSRVVAPSRHVVEGVLRGGIATGELAPIADLELVVDLLVGPVILRRMLAAARPPATAAQVEAVVDLVLAGLRPRG